MKRLKAPVSPEMLGLRILLLLAISCHVVTSYGDEDWGRLFTTPSERTRLDALRSGDAISASAVPTTPVNDTVPDMPPSAPIVIRGYVDRGDGQRGTVWVNDVAVMENAIVGEVAVGELRPGQGWVQLRLSHDRKPLQLKAGQTYVPATGEIIDSSVQAVSPEGGTQRPTHAVQGAAKQWRSSGD